MDKLITARENVLKAPETVKDYTSQHTKVYENKGPTYLSPVVKWKNTEELNDFDYGIAGEAITSALSQMLSWDRHKKIGNEENKD